MGHSEYDPAARERPAWNAGRMLGAKRALKPQQVWAIRFWLEREGRLRDRALFDLAIDSKLRGCDVVKIRISDLTSSNRVRTRATVVQQKTGRPVQFELLETARSSIFAWLERRGGTLEDYVFPSRINYAGHLSTRQYSRLVDEWGSGRRVDPVFTLSHGFDDSSRDQRIRPRAELTWTEYGRERWHRLTKQQVLAIVHYLEWRVERNGLDIEFGAAEALKSYWYERAAAR
jgi:hypothetical protein